LSNRQSRHGLQKNSTAISLESALSFYGLTTGFPYQITSLTPKKPKSFKVDGKEFIYSHLNPHLFWGYEKREDFLIAEREKALFDYLYFAAKGLRRIDPEELELASLDKKKFKQFLRYSANTKMLKLAGKLKI